MGTLRARLWGLGILASLASVAPGCRAGALSGARDEQPSAMPDADGPEPGDADAAPETETDPNASTSPATPTPSPPQIPEQPGTATQPDPSLDPCVSSAGRRIAVNTAGALTAALAEARPGDVIALADGTYEGNFVATAQASAAAPIALCGGPNAVLHGPSLTTGYTLQLKNARYWSLVGFAVTGGAKGVMLDTATFNTLKNLTVRGTGSEGIHLRTHSSDNLVDGCHVAQTGLAGDPKFGEGIYLGSSKNNWCKLTGGEADRSDRNVVQHCDVRQCTAEAIDIKEGTTGGQILGNTLDGQSIVSAAADSVVNVKGNHYLLQDNTLSHAPVDALSVHVILAGWGACNRFVGNQAADALTGYGIHLAAPKPWPAIQITQDNRFAQAAAGMSNSPVMPNAPAPSSCSQAEQSVACPN